MSKGILLVNLGSPESPTTKDVKPYLDEFLMDEYVIDLPYLLRAFVVKGIILNTRPKKSAAAYQKIWWNEGSPLIVLSNRLHAKVQQRVNKPVALAMRYGKPSIQSGLEELNSKGVTEVLVVPLYPQYAMASTKTIVEKSNDLQKKLFPKMTLHHFPAFYNKEDYIEVLSQSIADGLKGFDYDHFIFSYHGIPERHIKKTDVTKSHCKIDKSCCQTPSPAHEFCYRHQCYETTRQVVEKLNLAEDKISTTFQSRLGGDPWLKPYTDHVLEEMGQKGVKKLAIVTPAFVSDCLETLEEIAMEGAADFKAKGGGDFKAIPCMNDRDDWVNVLSKWLNDF